MKKYAFTKMLPFRTCPMCGRRRDKNKPLCGRHWRVVPGALAEAFARRALLDPYDVERPSLVILEAALAAVKGACTVAGRPDVALNAKADLPMIGIDLLSTPAPDPEVAP